MASSSQCILPPLETCSDLPSYLHSANSLFQGYCLSIERTPKRSGVLALDHYLLI